MSTTTIELLTVGDVAHELRVSTAAVRLWERDGKLPATRTAGGVRLFTREDVEAYRQRRQEKAAAGG